MTVTNRTKKIALIIFFISLWAPLLIAMATPDKEISPTEKRKLTPVPQLSWEGLAGFPKAFDQYYNDHFGLREQLLSSHSYYQFALFNVSSSNRVIVGKDGWLFQNGHAHVNDMRNLWPFSPGELQRWANVLTAKYKWCRGQGIAYIFVVTPSKHLIYPEMLPGGYQPVNAHSRVDQLIDYLQKNTDVPVVDMREALKKEKRKLRTYYKTDTHWNRYGAYIGYKQIMKQIKKELKGIDTVSLKKKDFKVLPVPAGDLANSLNLQQSLPEECPKPVKWDATCLTNSTIKGEQNDTTRNQQWFTTTCVNRKYDAIMFRDSFSVALMPYLSESFNSIYYIPHSPVPTGNMKKIVSEQRPDIVIEQRATRWLRTPEG